MKTYCEKCQLTEIDPNAKYCSSCGDVLVESPTKSICSKCLNLISTQAKYCPYCGEEQDNDKKISDYT